MNSDAMKPAGATELSRAEAPSPTTTGRGAVEQDARDPKTSLQEWAQARGMPPPVYTEQARSGPDHQPMFTVEVRLESGEAEQAIAGSKRVAEQAAARALLARMENCDD